MSLIKDSATILDIYFLLRFEALNSRRKYFKVNKTNINNNLFHYFSYAFLFPKISTCNFSWFIIWLYSGAISFPSMKAKKKKIIITQKMIHLTSVLP